MSQTRSTNGTFPLSKLPIEILEIIVAHLDFSTLKEARLVSRLWTTSATRCLFQTLTMTPDPDGLQRWQNVNGSEQLRSMPTHAIINTCPIPEYKPWEDVALSEEWDTVAAWAPFDWLLWKQGSTPVDDPVSGSIDLEMKIWFDEHPEQAQQYSDFYRSFNDLERLTTLRKAGLHFTPVCAISPRTDWDEEQGLEIWPYREDILKRFYAALRTRMEDPSNTAVHSLCIRNLQNVSNKVTQSLDFKAVMSNIGCLELLVADEFTRLRHQQFVYRAERYSFMSVLKHDWLMPVSSHLKSLDLSAHESWGSLPGKLDAKKLHFPVLRRLHLDSYSLAFDDSFDWILNQTSLRTLQLQDCHIASYVRLLACDVDRWHIDTNDWELVSQPVRTGTDMDATYITYHYPGTWARVFQSIQLQLPYLKSFVLIFEKNDCAVDDSIDASLSLISRYVQFDTEREWSPWVYPEWDGNMNVEMLNATTDVNDMFVRNEHEHKIETDLDALWCLMQDVEERALDR